MVQPKFGDIIEIPTQRGLAYAQYTHKNKMYGALIRVLSGFYDSRPDDIQALASGATKFTTFFPLPAAINRSIVTIIGNAAVPDASKQFPTFRSGTPDPNTKTVHTWWLWDGENKWRIDKLTEDQWKYPILGVWNDTLLIERIESDWLPENSSW